MSEQILDEDIPDSEIAQLIDSHGCFIACISDDDDDDEGCFLYTVSKRNFEILIPYAPRELSRLIGEVVTSLMKKLTDEEALADGVIRIQSEDPEDQIIALTFEPVTDPDEVDELRLDYLAITDRFRKDDAFGVLVLNLSFEEPVGSATLH